jgi:glycosyltransferase involved in cell wall biosynthesis
MKKLPRISIITPSYNQGHFIGQTIESVLSQGYPDLEYIIVDGASTDNTLDVLRSYDGRLTWISEKDRGQTHAINKGMQMATGDVVAFLNSDDLYLPGALETVGRFFAECPDAAWLTGRCRIIDQDNHEIRKGITLYKNAWLRIANYQTLQITNFISQMATFWRREAYERVGELNEGLHYVMDWDYWMRLGRRYKLSVIHRDLACFRMHATSKSGASATKAMAAANAQFDEEIRMARHHTRSTFLLTLHRLHNALIVASYRQALKRSSEVS